MEQRLRTPLSALMKKDPDAEGEKVNEDKKAAVDKGKEEEENDVDEEEDGDAEAEDEHEDEDAELESDDEEDELEEPSSRFHTRRTTRSDRARTRQRMDAKTSHEQSEDEEEVNEESSDEDEDEEDEAEVSADETNESIQVATRNNCVFCGQDEDHDPSPEFEENLACAACGDNAHRQCAREAESLGPYAHAASTWRCPNCVENNLQPDTSVTEPDSTEKANRPRRRSSTSRFTRDLLPASRGISRPGSHSVFNTLILDDDPLDGSRSLRKRKATSEQPELPQKRPRTQNSRPNGTEKTPERILAEKIERLNNAKSSASSSVEARSTRPSRTPKRRQSEPNAAVVKVVRKSSQSLVVSLPISPTRLKALAQRKKKKDRPRQSMSSLPERPALSSQYATPFYAFHERENDDLKSKPYGGILSEKDAETTLTLPLQADRLKFNKARERAEEERKERAALSEAEQETKGRSQKIAGPPSKIKAVYFGGYEIETWYAAPYPEEYSRNRVLYLCEFCLKYMNSDFVAWRHKCKCPARHPPGDEIYRDGSVSIFEVDGRKNPVYCQNLCLLAKLFLGSKTLYYDVEPFLFYVMTEADEYGCHFVGYFSKEKRPSSLNNVSCILTLPTHQRKGYGNLLISFSYLLTRVEGKTGSPEKPLSDMGLVSYRNYWRLTLSYELRDQVDPLSIPDLSDRTGMTADDIIAALEGLRALVRDPVTKTYALRLDYDYFDKCIADWEAKEYITLDPDALVWTPYIMGRSNLAHYETAPPLPTVAPREDQDEENDVAAEEGVQAASQAAAAATGTLANPAENDSAILDDVTAGPSQPNGTLSQSDEALLASQLHATPTPSSSLPHHNPTHTTIVNDISTPQNSPTKQPPQSSTFDIPPTRFEIWPPIPGTQARPKPKRGGFRPNAGTKRRTPGAPGSGSVTRSAAAQANAHANANATTNATTNGVTDTHNDNDDNDDDDGDGAANEGATHSPFLQPATPSSERMTRRRVASLSFSNANANINSNNIAASVGASNGAGTPVRRIDTGSSGGSGGSVRRSTRSSRRLDALANSTSNSVNNVDALGMKEGGDREMEDVDGEADAEGEDDDDVDAEGEEEDEGIDGDVRNDGEVEGEKDEEYEGSEDAEGEDDEDVDAEGESE